MTHLKYADFFRKSASFIRQKAKYGIANAIKYATNMIGLTYCRYDGGEML